MDGAAEQTSDFQCLPKKTPEGVRPVISYTSRTPIFKMLSFKR